MPPSNASLKLFRGVQWLYFLPWLKKLTCRCVKSSLTSELTVQGGAITRAVRRIRRQTPSYSSHKYRKNTVTHVTHSHAGTRQDTHDCTHTQGTCHRHEAGTVNPQFLDRSLHINTLPTIFFSYVLEKNTTRDVQQSQNLLLATPSPWNFQPLITVIL